MPWSEDRFLPLIEEMIREIHPSSIVDVGAGAGKFGEIARRTVPEASLLAIEVEACYIDRFRLREKYDEVVCSTAEDFFFSRPDFFVDLVILGDVLEHLKRSAGLDLLHYFAYRCRYLLATFPVKYVQYSWSGYAREAHISCWSVEDFSMFDARFWKDDHLRLVRVRGFLEDEEAVFAPSVRGILRRTPGT